MKTQRKKTGIFLDTTKPWVLRPILQPFEISRRYTICIFGLRKAWGIQPCASLEVEKSHSKNGKFFIFIFPLKKSIFSKKMR
jgi:hypothetical protein